MSPSANYKTQSSAYDRLLVGRRLTDRIIARRKKQGFYGNEGILFKSKEKTKRKHRSRRTIDDLLADFDV
jgi:hypothetical protein